MRVWGRESVGALAALSDELSTIVFGPAYSAFWMDFSSSPSLFYFNTRSVVRLWLASSESTEMGPSENSTSLFNAQEGGAAGGGPRSSSASKSLHHNHRFHHHRRHFQSLGQLLNILCPRYILSQVLSLPMARLPLFPEFYKAVVVRSPARMFARGDDFKASRLFSIPMLAESRLQNLSKRECQDQGDRTSAGADG